jgi:hypothetical protein
MGSIWTRPHCWRYFYLDIEIRVIASENGNAIQPLVVGIDLVIVEGGASEVNTTSSSFRGAKFPSPHRAELEMDDMEIT